MSSEALWDQAFRRRIMGSVPLHEWFQCDWCGWWGYFSNEEMPEKYELIDVDMVGFLCVRCFGSREPPWRPNNRDRCHRWMIHLFANSLDGDNGTTRLIAEFLADNAP